MKFEISQKGHTHQLRECTHRTSLLNHLIHHFIRLLYKGYDYSALLNHIKVHPHCSIRDATHLVAEYVVACGDVCAAPLAQVDLVAAPTGVPEGVAANARGLLQHMGKSTTFLARHRPSWINDACLSWRMSIFQKNI